MYTRRIEQPKNNALHEAILERDHDTAFQLALSMNSKEINQVSLGNTPLMLALKTANFAVASKILEREDIEFSIADHRGMTPLQLACAWRENEIILALIAKHKAAELSIDPRFDFEKLTGVHDLMKRLLEKRTLAKIYNDYNVDTILAGIKEHGYDNSIYDEPSLCILAAPELTDTLLFHSKPICLNLGLIDARKFKDSHSSQSRFANDLIIGLHAVLDYRNAKPKDARVVKIINTDTPTPTGSLTNLRK